jgi:hypothetical protein
MQTISNDSLDSVTGGTGSIPGGSPTAGATPAVAGGATGGTLGTGTCGGGLLGALNGLNNSIQGLNNNNNGGFNATDMLMFGMAMAFSRSEVAAYPAYYVVGGYGGFGGCGHGCGGGGFRGRW